MSYKKFTKDIGILGLTQLTMAISGIIVLPVITKILGAPKYKDTGIYFEKKIGSEVDKGDKLCRFYSYSLHNLKEAKDSLGNFPIYTIY